MHSTNSITNCGNIHIQSDQCGGNNIYINDSPTPVLTNVDIVDDKYFRTLLYNKYYDLNFKLVFDMSEWTRICHRDIMGPCVREILEDILASNQYQHKSIYYKQEITMAPKLRGYDITENDYVGLFGAYKITYRTRIIDFQNASECYLDGLWDFHMISPNNDVADEVQDTIYIKNMISNSIINMNLLKFV